MTQVISSAEQAGVYPVLDVVRQRWSPRAFADRPVEPEKLVSILEAARWAASARNEQPWRFILTTRATPDAFERLYATLSEHNQRWAVTAPVLLMAVASTRFARNGYVNRFAWHDVGLAIGNLLTQATALDLFGHQMGGFDADAARAAFAVPAEYDPVTVIALGYRADLASLTDEERAREETRRPRRPLAELVFTEAWGAAAELPYPADE